MFKRATYRDVSPLTVPELQLWCTNSALHHYQPSNSQVISQTAELSFKNPNCAFYKIWAVEIFACTWIHLLTTLQQCSKDAALSVNIINERVILSVSFCSQAVCGGLQRLEGYPSVSCGLHDMRSVRHVKQGPSSLWIGGRLSGCGSVVLRFSCRCRAAFWPLEGASESGSLTLRWNSHKHFISSCSLKQSWNFGAYIIMMLYSFNQWSDNKC